LIAEDAMVPVVTRSMEMILVLCFFHFLVE
jgi:hypothetical protein